MVAQILLATELNRRVLLGDLWPDWLIANFWLPKLRQAMFFYLYLVVYQNLPIPHIWLVKSVTNIFT